MEKIENIEAIEKLFNNSVGELLNKTRSTSPKNYDYIYGIVYGRKYGDVIKFSKALCNTILGQMSSKGVNLTSVFSTNFLNPREKQLLVTYWSAMSFLNATAKKKELREKGVNFLSISNEYLNNVRAMFSTKVFEDENGTKINGSEIFSDNIDAGKEISAKDTLSEFALTAFLISTAVFCVLGAASPAIAKACPGACDVVRKCADKFPVATKILDWTISPVDLEAFVEQDKINKGEYDEEGDFELQDDGDEEEDNEVLMADGTVVDISDDNDNAQAVELPNASKEPKKEIKTFTDENGQEFQYEFIDYDV